MMTKGDCRNQTNINEGTMPLPPPYDLPAPPHYLPILYNSKDFPKSIRRVIGFDEKVQKLKVDNLMANKRQIKIQYKHFKKLKRRWSIVKDITKFSTLGVIGLCILDLPLVILFPPIGLSILLGLIAGEFFVILPIEILSMIKVNKYSHKCKTLRVDSIINDHDLHELEHLN